MSTPFLELYVNDLIQAIALIGLEVRVEGLVLVWRGRMPTRDSEILRFWAAFNQLKAEPCLSVAIAILNRQSTVKPRPLLKAL